MAGLIAFAVQETGSGSVDWMVLASATIALALLAAAVITSGGADALAAHFDLLIQSAVDEVGNE